MSLSLEQEMAAAGAVAGLRRHRAWLLAKMWLTHQLTWGYVRVQEAAAALDKTSKEIDVLEGPLLNRVRNSDPGYSWSQWVTYGEELKANMEGIAGVQGVVPELQNLRALASDVADSAADLVPTQTQVSGALIAVAVVALAYLVFVTRGALRA